MDRPLASRYAKALFKIKLPQQALEAFHNHFKQIFQQFEQEPALIKILSSPLIPKKEKFQLLKKMLEGRIDPILMNFLLLLMAKGRFAALPEIVKEFDRELQNQSGILDARVETAVPLDPQQKAKLVSKLEHAFNKKIYLKEHLNPKIVGGGKLFVAHYMLDTTINMKFSRLKTYLQHTR